MGVLKTQVPEGRVQIVGDSLISFRDPSRDWLRGFWHPHAYDSAPWLGLWPRETALSVPSSDEDRRDESLLALLAPRALDSDLGLVDSWRIRHGTIMGKDRPRGDCELSAVEPGTRISSVPEQGRHRKRSFGERGVGVWLP
jgi:hypothetical protein